MKHENLRVDSGFGDRVATDLCQENISRSHQRELWPKADYFH